MTHNSLAHKKCSPCRGGVLPLKGEAIKHLYDQLEKGWKVVNDHHLEKEYVFEDFRHALAFINLLGEVAEKEGHHPDFYLSWVKVKITLWTHKIDGLTESDFIMAAKADEQCEHMKHTKACF